MALLSDSCDILPIHRKILAFTFIGWIFDFYDLLLLTFVVSSTSLVKDLALSGGETGVLLGTALGFTAVGGLIGGEWAVAHALVGETVPPHVRGRYGSYLQSGSAFARFFATMVGNLLAPIIGWRQAFMLSALPALM